MNVGDRGERIKGLTLHSVYTGPHQETDAHPYSKFDLELVYCGSQ